MNFKDNWNLEFYDGVKKPLEDLEKSAKEFREKTPDMNYTASEREYIDSAKDDRTRELRTKIVDNKRKAYQRAGVENGVDYIKRAGGEYSGLAPKGMTFEDVADAQINRVKRREPDDAFNRAHVDMMAQARKDGFEVSRGEDGKVRLYANGTGEEPERTDYIKRDGLVRTYTVNIPTSKSMITGNNPVTKEGDYTVWNPATQHEDGTLLKNERPFRVELTPEEQKELDTTVDWKDYKPSLGDWAKAHPEEFRQQRISQILDRRIGPDGRNGYYHDIDPKTMGWKQHSLKWDALKRAWVNEDNDPLVDKYLQRHPELKRNEQKGR